MKKKIVKKAKQAHPKKITKKRSLTPFYILAALLLGTAFFLTQLQQRQYNVSKAAGDCTVSTGDLTTKAEEQTMFTQLNAYRAQNGVPAVVWSPTLKKAAEWMSIDMSSKNYLNHIDSLGRDTGARLTDCGFDINEKWAENITDKLTDPAQVMAQWEADAVHKANLLNTQYTQVGIAVTNGFWVQDFGSGVPSDSTAPSVAVIPSATVPSPNCLGGCPVSPSIGQASTAPAPSIAPSTAPSVAPSQTISSAPSVGVPAVSNPPVSGTPSGGGSGNNSGFLGLLLQLLGLFLQFLMKLFGN